MTANQINYARHREDSRHNLETERQGRDVIKETNRHNVEQEKIGWGNVGVGYAQVAENRRHNVRTEMLNMYDLTSQRRLRDSQIELNRAQSQLATGNLDVSRYNADINAARVNAVRRSNEIAARRADEESRHNKAMESIGQYNVDINRYNANTQRSNVESQNWFREQQINETARHNRRQEEMEHHRTIDESTRTAAQFIGTVVGRGGLLGGIGALVGGSR